ncbi:MAG: hypothetical protein ACKOGH_13615 [Alphaproteobacteria bacterium]
MSLAVAFPFNILAGIPLYFVVLSYLWSSPCRTPGRSTSSFPRGGRALR